MAMCECGHSEHSHVSRGWSHVSPCSCVVSLRHECWCGCDQFTPSDRHTPSDLAMALTLARLLQNDGPFNINESYWLRACVERELMREA